MAVTPTKPVWEPEAPLPDGGEAAYAARPPGAAGAQAPPRRPLLGAAVRRLAPGALGGLALGQLGRLAPGMLVAAAGVVLAIVLNRLVPPIGVLTGAVILGAV